MNIPLCVAETGAEEVAAVKELLTAKQPWLAHGPKNKELEQLFTNYLGVKHALTTNSCASALILALQGLNIIGEVIIPSFSFSATGNAVLLAGATPVFADIDARTLNIDPNKIEPLITDRTQAIMPVHIGGQIADMQPIMDLANKHNLKVIEDTAETIGGTYQGKQAGSIGHVGCFSFFPVKNMTTGEGGLLSTYDDELIAHARKLTGHGVIKDPERKWARSAVLPGYNFRMSNINAAIGVEQFKKLDVMNEKRRQHAAYLTSNLKGVTTPHEQEGTKHVYQMYIIKVPEGVQRDAFVAFLNQKGIEASVHFDPPIHQQDYYKGKYITGDLTVTDQVCKQVVTLPMFPSLTQEQLDYMIAAVEEGLHN